MLESAAGRATCHFLKRWQQMKANLQMNVASVTAEKSTLVREEQLKNAHAKVVRDVGNVREVRAEHTQKRRYRRCW